jgi:hypothetical protein
VARARAERDKHRTGSLWARVVASALAVASLSACSSYTTLTLRDGRIVQGRILGTDGDSIRVEGGTVAPEEASRATGKEVLVATDGDSSVSGKLSDATSVQRSESGETFWRRVCVEPEGAEAEEADPVCVPGDRVDSVTSVRRIARDDLESTDASLDEKPGGGEAGQLRMARHWYGEQTLLVDGASLALGIAMVGAGADGEGAAVLVGGYLFGAPLVHLSHDHPGKAFGSLGLRLGLPLAGAALSCLGGGCDYRGEDTGAAVGGAILVVGGAVLGAAVAITIDSALIANEDVVSEAQRPAVGVRPQLSIGKQQTLVGMTGWF